MHRRTPEGELRCPNCGKIVKEQETKGRCPNCNAHIKEDYEARFFKPRYLTCPKCHSQIGYHRLLELAMYCPVCGAKVED